MLNTSYSNTSDIYVELGISTSVLNQSMGMAICNRAAQFMNKRLNAPTLSSSTGIAYVDFQCTTNSSTDSYVDATTFSLIKKAHLFLSCSWVLDINTIPTIEEYMVHNQKVVEYRQDFHDNTKAKIYLEKYQRIMNQLLTTDDDDNYFDCAPVQGAKGRMCNIDPGFPDYYYREAPQ